MSILRSRGKTRLSAISMSTVALGLVLLLLASNPRVRSLVMAGNPSPGAQPIAALNDGPTVDRLFMAQASFNIVQHRPWGLGVGNVGRLYERYRPLTAGTGLNQVQQMHNTPLQLLVELGVLGFFWYSTLHFCFIKLARYTVSSPSLSPPERRLGLTLAIGLVGYGVSSLSDYQLENIPIATTLTILLASLIKLGDAASDISDMTVSRRSRRWGSVLVLIVIALMVQFWLRSNLAVWMTQRGLTAIDRGNLIQSDDRFYTAAKLTPWDPTPSALQAQQLTEIARSVEGDDQAVVRREAIALYQQALQAAPNDIWFNHNLAVLAWQTGDTATAYRTMAKVVQLSPRSKNHSYYLLGLMAESLGDRDAAIDAWALECLINPQAILFTSWYQELSPFRTAVFERTLQHYQTILAQLTPQNPLHSSIETHITMLRWWSGKDIVMTPKRLFLQALLLMETDAKQATGVLEQCIEEESADASACGLLKAWLMPEDLVTYTARLDVLDQDILRSHITEYRNFQSWLRSTTQPVVDSYDTR
ncbi:MAG: O-antigen ligase family protein [Cyanobacteria bacterium J06642_11]